MEARTKTKIALALNLVLAALVAYSVSTFFVTGGQGNMQVVGATCFRYFTIDSNILAAITCLVMAVFQARLLRTGAAVPHWALVLKYVGTGAVTLTCLVVLCFLGPILGYGPLFAGENLFTHGLVPLGCVLGFELLEPGSIRRKEVLLDLLPVAVYGIVYLTMVVVVGEAQGGWPDFYYLNTTGTWYLSFVAMGVAMLAIGLVEWLPHRRAGAAE